MNAQLVGQVIGYEELHKLAEQYSKLARVISEQKKPNWERFAELVETLLDDVYNSAFDKGQEGLFQVGRLLKE